jgi:hypothetical protein
MMLDGRRHASIAPTSSRETKQAFRHEEMPSGKVGDHISVTGQLIVVVNNFAMAEGSS